MGSSCCTHSTPISILSRKLLSVFLSKITLLTFFSGLRSVRQSVWGWAVPMMVRASRLTGLVRNFFTKVCWPKRCSMSWVSLRYRERRISLEVKSSTERRGGFGLGRSRARPSGTPTSTLASTFTLFIIGDGLLLIKQQIQIMQMPNAPKRRSLRDQLKLSLNKQREALSNEKENNPRPVPRDSKAKAILIENYSCSPQHGDRTKRAKSRLCKQIRRIAIDRSEKQVRLAKRCEQLILLARNFVNSSGRVLKLFPEATRDNDLNLKIFISQKYSLSEYLDDLDKQVNTIKSEDIDLSKENEELKQEIDRLSRALKKDHKETGGKDARERVFMELRKDEMDTVKRFVRERAQFLEQDFGKLLEFTDKEYKLRLILQGREKELTREKEAELNDMIQFVRGECEQHLMGKQYSERPHNDDKAVTYKVRELLKYLKVQYSGPANTLSLLEMLELKLYNLKIELVPTIKRQNEAYSKEIKQLRADLDNQLEENRKMGKTNLSSLEEQVKVLRGQLTKIEQLRDTKQSIVQAPAAVKQPPQYFTHQRSTLQRQILELQRQKTRLQGIVNRVFQQLQSVCVSNNLVKRQELRDLNYQGLMDILQKTLNSESTRQQRERDARQRRRIENESKISSLRVAELEKEKLAVVRALSNLEEEFEMLLSQKLYLEEVVERMRATHEAELQQARRTSGEEGVVQTDVDGVLWEQIQQGNYRNAKAIEEMVEKQKEFEKVAEEMKAELELKKENLIEARGKIEELTSETQKLYESIAQKESKLSLIQTQLQQVTRQLADRTTQVSQQLKNIEHQTQSVRLLQFQVDTLNKGQKVLKQQLSNYESIISQHNTLIQSLNLQVIKLVQAQTLQRTQTSTLSSTLQTTKSALEQLQSSYKLLQNQLAFKQQNIEYLENQLSSQKMEALAKSSELELLRDSSSEMQNAREETATRLEKEIETLRAQVAEKVEEVTKLKHEGISIMILNEENRHLKAENQEKELTIRMLDEELTGQIRLKEECSHLRQALEEANDKISSAEKTLVELQSQVLTLKSQATQKEELIKELSQQKQEKIEYSHKLKEEFELKFQQLESTHDKRVIELQSQHRQQLSRFEEQHTQSLHCLQQNVLSSLQTSVSQLVPSLLSTLLTTLITHLAPLTTKLQVLHTTISSALSRKLLRKDSQTKQLMGKYSHSCSKLQVEINKLVEQLEVVKCKSDSSRLLEEALKGSERMREEGERARQGIEEELRMSRGVIEQQEGRIKDYQNKLHSFMVQSSSMINSVQNSIHESGTPYKSNAMSQVLGSCIKMLDFNNPNVSKEAEVQTDQKPMMHKYSKEIRELKRSCLELLGEYKAWLFNKFEESERQFKIFFQRSLKPLQLLTCFAKKFKLTFSDQHSLLQQTTRFLNQYQQPTHTHQQQNHYFQVLQKLVQQLLCNRVSLNLQQQIKTLQPGEKEKILGYRKKIADLQYQLTQKDELKEKIREQEGEITHLRAEVKAKEKRIGIYENQVHQKENMIMEMKNRKIIEPSISQSQQSMFLIEDDLLDKEISGSVEGLNQLLDQSGICSDEIAFTKSELTRCLKDNNNLKEKLKGARHHLKRIVDLIEGHSGGTETNARIYQAVLNCRRFKYMIASCPHCKTQYDYTCGYHPSPCPLPTPAKPHPNQSFSLVVSDILCKCGKIIGYEVIAGPKQILKKWKLMDELYRVDEKSLGRFVKNEMLQLLKRYEACTQKACRIEGMLLETERLIQIGYQYIKNHQKK